jgi:AcrR family transcriptional regulator
MLGAMASLPEAFTGRAVGAERLPKEVIVSHQRERVLEAAVAVIAKRGYTATTLDHILVAAKVGVGTFYELFENKDALLAAAHERTLAVGRERIAAAVAGERDWGRQVRAAVEALLELIAEEPQTARFALVEVQSGGPEALGRYEAMLAEASEALRSGRRVKGAAEGLPEDLEFSLVSGVVWVLQQRIVAGTATRGRTVMPQLVGVLTEPYLGEKKVQRLLAGD